MSDPYIDIPIDGKTAEEVLDAIYEAREGYAPMWWPELRLLAGKLREPLEVPRFNDAGTQEWVMISEVPAGSRVFGVLVV